MSIDPRVNRIDLNKVGTEDQHTNSHLVTWEVFHQDKKGKQVVHAGIVHASNPDMALILAKEQFGRRGHTTNIWVAKTTDVFSFGYEDQDIFETTPEKTFRNPEFYKVRDRIEAYQAKHQTI